MRTPYTWLTSPLRASDGFLGPATGLSLPSLVRHGYCAVRDANSGFTLDENAAYVRSGGCRFNLAAVRENGQALDLSNTFFLIRSLMTSARMVVGAGLLAAIRERCNLDDGHVIRLHPERVSFHAWNYSLPETPADDRMYRRLYKELGLESSPGDDEIIRQLCERFPFKGTVPEMHLILTPSLHPQKMVVKKWVRDEIVLSAAESVVVEGRSGEKGFSVECLEGGPIISFEGFLLPPKAKELFEADSSDVGGRTLASTKDVVIEYR